MSDGAAVLPPPEDVSAFSPEGDARSLKARSAAGAAMTLAGQGGRFILQFGSQVALARLLMPTDFGLIAMVAPLIAAALLLTDLGLSSATIQRPTISQSELSSLFWLNVLIGGVLSVGTMAAAPLVTRFYHTPALLPVVLAMAVTLLLASLAAQHLAILNRRMRFGAITVIEVGAIAIGVVTGVGSALAGLGYWSLVAMQLANSVAMTAMAWMFTRWRPSAPRIGRDAFHLIRFGGAVTGYNLLGYLISNLNTILIGARFGAGPLGIYDRAYKLVFQPLWQMTAPAARVAVPLLSRLGEEEAEYRGAYLTMLGAVLALTVPGLLCAMLFAGPIIDVLLGTRWAAAAPIFAWLALCAITLQLRQAAGWLFVSQGRAQEQLKWGGLGSVAIVLSYLIGIHWGPVGVAIAMALSSGLIQVPLIWWAVTRSGPIRGGDIIALLLPIGVATLATGTILSLLARQPVWTSVPRLFAIIVLAYALFLATMGLTTGGRAWLARALSLSRALRRRLAPR
jgi:PST family polysaccharide transporter